MINLIFRPQTLLIAIPLLSLVASNYATAEIYKWRDSRGVTQYSDRPPVSNYSKVTRNEMVNALQTKDLCTVGPIVKKVSTNVASNENQSGFFSKLIRSGPSAISSNKPSTITAVLAAKNVTVLGISTQAPKPSVAVTAPVTPIVTPTAPITNTPPTPTAPPVTVAPPAPVLPVAPPPTQVVTNNPPPTTPPVTNTNPNIVQVALMPAVDISKNLAPVMGWNDLRIRPNLGPQDEPKPGDGDGQFRIDCDVSHMSNDDPILYPNQQGAAHHHTFFGNTSLNYKSNLMTLSTTGNSTCRGGIANRSAYWVPSIIDTSTKTPLKPYSALWYYKTGYIVSKSKITAPAKGLRIIAGNMKSTSAITSDKTSFTCFKEGYPSPPDTKHIPACGQGWTIVTHISFPQCWDGKNLDSPDHQSHMSYTVNSGCPASHPVAIPHVGLNIKYLITSNEGTKNWRMSSDNYAVNGNNAGYSSHADWVNGWDEKVMSGIIKNCLQAGKDCGSHMLGDGTVIYGLNRDF